MKALEAVKSVATVAKAVVAAITSSTAKPTTPKDRHAEDELRRRAEVNARGAALRAESVGRGWLPPRGASWFGSRER